MTSLSSIQSCFILALLILLAMSLFLSSSAFDLCVYDRRLIIEGQWWRLFTGNLVHFSFSHLALNVATLIAIILAAEHKSPSGMQRVALIGFMAIGPGLFLVDSRLEVYGGLSGVTSGCIGYALKHSYYSSDKGLKFIYGCGIVGCLCKVLLECYFELPFFAALPPGVKNVPLSHLLGYLMALFTP